MFVDGEAVLHHLTTAAQAGAVQRALAESDWSLAPDLLAFLSAHKLIEPADAPSRAALSSQRWSRELSAWSARFGLDGASAAFARLAHARVLLIGVGGLGSHIADHLARIGVGALDLVDGDVVEPGNLNRQILYDPGALGALKIEAARRRLGQIAPQMTVRCFQSVDEWISIEGDAAPDMTFVSADEDQWTLCRTLISHLYPRRSPYMFCGYNGRVARLGPGIFDFSRGCGTCVAQVSDLSRELTLHHAQCSTAASGYAINAMAAALSVERWKSRLAGEPGDLGRVTISWPDLIRHEKPLRALASCPVCAGGHDE